MLVKNNSSALEQALKTIKQHEGYRKFAYTCPAGKLTIGYGTNLQQRGISNAEATMLVENDLLTLHKALALRLEFYTGLSARRQAVLLDMAYNLGLGGLMRFKKMLAALQAHDYNKAAAEMLNSKWAKQVGMRAANLATIMRAKAKMPGQN